MADPTESTQIRRWVETWKRAGPELERHRIDELRALTEEQAASLFDTMWFDAETIWLPADRIDSVGLIEQQHLFMRSHEHPASRRRRA
jgi:hypothetical protein